MQPEVIKNIKHLAGNLTYLSTVGKFSALPS